MKISISTDSQQTLLVVHHPAPVPPQVEAALQSNDGMFFSARSSIDELADDAEVSDEFWSSLEDATGLTMSRRFVGPWCCSTVLRWAKATAARFGFALAVYSGVKTHNGKKLTADNSPTVDITFDFNEALGLTEDELSAASQAMPAITYSLGHFELTQPYVRVTDPCYNDIPTSADLVAALPGKWRAQALVGPTYWHTRVKRLQVSHDDLGPMPMLDTEAMEDLGITAGVDSGQCGFFDNTKYPSAPSEFEYEGNTFYSRCCDRTLDDRLPGGGVVPENSSSASSEEILTNVGAVTSSGFGDGGYRVFASRDSSGDIVVLTLLFIGDHETGEAE